MNRDVNRRLDGLRQMERHYRQTGYDDGYMGKPAASLNTYYQQGWKRGMEARRALADGAA